MPDGKVASSNRGVNSELTIIVDSREKKPLPFPEHLPSLRSDLPALSRSSRTYRLKMEKRTLVTGDYALKGYEAGCLIERKGSLAEVAGNCLTADGRRKFVAAMDRLKEACLYPYLLLEGNILESLTPTKDLPDPWNAIDSLHRILLERNIGLILLPNTSMSARRAVAEWAARLLVNAALCPILPANTPEEPPCPTTSNLSPPLDLTTSP